MRFLTDQEREDHPSRWRNVKPKIYQSQFDATMGAGRSPNPRRKVQSLAEILCVIEKARRKCRFLGQLD